MRSSLIIIFMLAYGLNYSQQPAITRIDPTNWWVGMKNQNLQLLVYGPKAGTLAYSINYPGVQLVKTNKVENPNYAFLDLRISSTAKAGKFEVTGRSGSQKNHEVIRIEGKN